MSLLQQRRNLPPRPPSLTKEEVLRPQLEKKAKEPTKEEDKAKEIPESGPQPNLGSYYNLLEGGKIIPQNFAVPLFFKLEMERIRTHTWMQIAKSKKVEDVGLMEEKVNGIGK